MHLKEWFDQPNDEDQSRWDTCKILIELQNTCFKCGKPLEKDKAWSWHALPWGYGTEIWCSEECAYA